jgi:3'-5' exoribonuclease
MTNKKIFIRELSEGQTISDIFALAQAQRKETKNGQPYWDLTLTDRTGSMAARIWSPGEARHKEPKPEQFVVVTGLVVSFKDKLQVNVTDLVLIDPAETGLAMSDFLPSSVLPPEELLSTMEALLAAELSFKPWRTLCTAILTDGRIRAALLSAPGAKTIHHAYVGGLLEHTLGVMRICRALADLYPGVDREVLLVAALCHDLGKAFELSHGISREYTDAGRLLGHIQMGLEALEPLLRKAKDLPEELAMHLKHLIVSHHGEQQFGSPCVPQTVEAFILHHADNLDAKINTVRGALTLSDGQEMAGWSDYHRTLGRYLYQPRRTPAASAAKKPHPPCAKKKETKSDDFPLNRFMGPDRPAPVEEDACS